MKKRIELEPGDYVSLYPYMLPREIVEEFGEERCKTQRAIYYQWNNNGFEAPKKAKDRLLQGIAIEYKLKHPEKDIDDIRSSAEAIIARETEERKLEIWKRIDKTEYDTNNMRNR